jgi:4-amino-4-deoxy-L-arabinose transferase-like glycosyltransferase
LSSRMGYALAVLLLLLAAVLRMWQFTTLPAGLSQNEITDIRITETMRQGGIEVFYDLGDEGRESLYHAVLAAVTGLMGSGQLGYHVLSLWVSLLTLALVYVLAMRLYGPLAGVAALALLVVNMHFILAARQVEREIILPALVVAVLLSLARALEVYRRSRMPVTTAFAALGLLLGVGFYIHQAHFMIFLFSVIFIVYRLSTHPSVSKTTITYLRFSLLIMIIIATPYLISSIRLPELSGVSRLWGDYNITQVSPLQAYVDGLLGLFIIGDSNPLHNLPGRPLIDLVSGLLLVVGFLTAFRGWRQPRFAQPLIAFAILSPVVFLSAQSPNFQQYLLLLPVLALFFGIGVSTLYHSFTSLIGRRVAAGVLAALLAFNLIWLLPDLFDRWPSQTTVYEGFHSRLGQIAHYMDRTAARTPTLICDTRPSDGLQGTRLSDTDMLLLMMNRKKFTPRYADCGSALVFINGGEGQQVIFPASNSLEGLHPYLRTWLDQGQIVTGAGVPPNAIVNLNVMRSLADTIGRFTTTAPAGYEPGAVGPSALAVPPVRFGGNLTFLGYEQKPTTDYTQGGIVTSITYWRVDGPLPTDLRFFTHILADSSTRAAQNDVISVDVSQMQARDVFIQVTFVPLPLTIPEGQYSISIGAYRVDNGVRMGVLDGDLPRGTRLFLGQINVIKAGG